jgi:anti-anti-sigma factor
LAKDIFFFIVCPDTQPKGNTMQVTIQSENNATIAAVEGRMDAVTAPELESQLSTIIDEGQTSVILDLSGLEYISSAGLRVILTTAKKLKTAQGKLVLCNLQETVKQIFEISGFCSILNIADDKESALSEI